MEVRIVLGNKTPKTPGGVGLRGSGALTLTMLCLSILWTTGVKTSITTIDRGLWRQCCTETEKCIMRRPLKEPPNAKT